MLRRKEAADLLGCSMHAPAEEIEKAYRQKIKCNHPDKGGSDEIAAQLTTARERLLDHIEVRRPKQPLVTAISKIERPSKSPFKAYITISGFCNKCNARGYCFPEEGDECTFCANEGVILNSSGVKTCVACRGSGFVLKPIHICKFCSLGERTYIYKVCFDFDPAIADGVTVHEIEDEANGFKKINFCFYYSGIKNLTQDGMISHSLVVFERPILYKIARISGVVGTNSVFSRSSSFP